MIPVRTPGTIGHVPNKPKTQHRSLRVDMPEWVDLELGAEDIGLDRSKVINQLLKWWLRRPGAELPELPSSQRIEEIVATRALSLTIECPACKVASGSCMTIPKAGTEKAPQPIDAIHRERLATAASIIAAQSGTD